VNPMLPVSDMMPAATVLIVVAVLMVSTVTDVAWHRIPNVVLFPALLVALVLQFAFAGLSGVVSAVSGLFIGIAFLLPLYALGGMGAGDAKLLGVVGAFLGHSAILIAGAFTLIAGAILGLLYIAARAMPVILSHVQRLMRTRANFEGRSRRSNTSRFPAQQFCVRPGDLCGTLIAMWQQNLFST
jgi:prepilin peptidase CpaA